MTAAFMDLAPERVSLHHGLQGKADDYIIGGWDDDFAADEHVTCAATTDELRELTRGLNERCQWQIDPAYIEAQIAHEAEHADAALAVGFSRVRYGLGEWVERRMEGDVLAVTTRWQVMVFHVAPVRPVTKLAYASIVAAPACLSAGDAQALVDMGYRDAAEVADRLAAM